MKDHRIGGEVAASATSARLFVSSAPEAVAAEAVGGTSQTVAAQAIPTGQYESQVTRFKPVHGLAALNSNDLRRFVYEWFTHFEHAAPAAFYLAYLDDKHMYADFPGGAPLTSHTAFAGWYNNLLAQTLWNFHDISAIQIRQTADQEYLITFVVDWYGEVKADSDQRAEWQTRDDSNLYHHKLRQTWTVKSGDRPLIERLVVSNGDVPSLIIE